MSTAISEKDRMVKGVYTPIAKSKEFADSLNLAMSHIMDLNRVSA